MYADPDAPALPLFGAKDSGAFSFLRGFWYAEKLKLVWSSENKVWTTMNAGVMGRGRFPEILLFKSSWATQHDGGFGDAVEKGKRLYLRFDLDQAYAMNYALIGTTGGDRCNFGLHPAEFYTASGKLDPSTLKGSTVQDLTGQGWVLQKAWEKDPNIRKDFQFARLRAFVELARKLDIVVEVAFFNGMYKDCWPLMPLYHGNNIQGVGNYEADAFLLFTTAGARNADVLERQKAYVRKITAELNSYDICDEPTINGGKDSEMIPWILAMKDAFLEAERALPKKHVLGQTVQSSSPDLSGDAWCDWLPTEYVAAARAALEKNYGANKPIVDVESDYYGYGLVKPYTVDDVRAEGWWFMLGGGAGFIHLNGEYCRGQETGGPDTQARIVPEKKLLRDFMESLDLVGLRRFTGLGGVPAGAFASAIAEPGRQYAVYLFHGKNDGQWGAHYVVTPGTFEDTLTLISVPSGEYNLEWIEPATGTVKRKDARMHSGGGFKVTISDVKLVGLWRYNADGIDVCNSENVTVKDSFVRAFDDALVLKGLKFGRDSFDDRPVRDVRFSRCVVWCDWGRAMEIGAETCAPEIAGIVFEDCDIVRTTHIAMDIQHGDRATIRDIRFANVRVEVDDWNPPPRMQQAKDEKYPEKPGDTYCPTLFEIVIHRNFYSKDEDRGSVRDIIFKDITVTSRREPRSSFRGLDAEHGVEGVTIQNLRFNGRPVGNAQEAHLDIGPHVKEVRFGGAAVAPPDK